jgi:hypothetical protein
MPHDTNVLMKTRKTRATTISMLQIPKLIDLRFDLAVKYPDQGGHSEYSSNVQKKQQKFCVVVSGSAPSSNTA